MNMWKDLSMKDKAAIMKVAIKYGITDLDTIRNKFDEGGSILGISVPKEVETVASFVPILGTLMDGEQLYNEPSWKNAGALGVSILAEIPFLKWLKAGKVAKVAKNVEKYNEAKQAYDKANKVVQRMETTPNINPNKLSKAKNRRGDAYHDMLIGEHSRRVVKDKVALSNQESINNLINLGLITTDWGTNAWQQFSE